MFCEKCGFEYEGEKCPVCEAEVVAVENVEVEAVAKKSKLFGILGLVAGIASVAFALIGGLLIGFLGGILFTILLILPAIIPGAAAIVLGAIGLKNSKGMGITAIILGAASILAYIIAGVAGSILAGIFTGLLYTIAGNL